MPKMDTAGLVDYGPLSSRASQREVLAHDYTNERSEGVRQILTLCPLSPCLVGLLGGQT